MGRPIAHAAVGLSGVLLLLGACSHDAGGPPAAVAGFGLHYNDQGETSALAYGRPNSDDVALMLQCEKGSGQVLVSDVLRSGSGPSLVLTSQGRRAELAARVEPGMSGGPEIVTGALSAASPVLSAFRSSGKIAVAMGQLRYGVQAGAEERERVERFFSDCGQSA